MFSDVHTYGFINAKLKTRLSLMLSEDFFTRLSRCPTLSEAMILLKDSEYENAEKAYAGTGDLKMSELALLHHEISLFGEIRKHVDGIIRDFLDALLLRYETEILKQALRLWFDRVIRKRDITLEAAYLPREQILTALPLEDIIAAPDYDTLVSLFPAGPYRESLSANRDEVESSRSLFSVEMALDLHFYKLLQISASAFDTQNRKIIERMTGVEIDMENITRILRFMYFFRLERDQIVRYILPGGLNLKPGLLSQAAENPDNVFMHISASGYSSLSPLGGVSGETSNPLARMELIGSFLTEILRKEISRLLSGNPFTIGILLSYFMLKRQEIRRISAVLNGINYRLPDDRMRRI